jgi:penicillin-binding protein 1A
LSDWNLDPYRFPDSQPSGAKGPAAPEPPPPPEEPFRADLPPPRRRRKGGRERTLIIVTLVLIGLLIGGAAGGAGFIWWKYLRDTPALPATETLFSTGRAPGIQFLDRNGQPIAARGPRYGERVRLSQLPAYAPQAFLAAEDRRFYKHGPVDLYAIARAVWVNWRADRVVQGASTLSQQLAKGLFLTPDQTLKRKLQEALLAWRLEKALSKDEVLELYLNRIFFGANTYGIDGAARTYFGKTAAQLTLSESALLAALPKAPSRLALNRGMAGALARSALILAQMRREGWITPEQEQAALAETPRLTAQALRGEGDYGWVLDYATLEAVRLAGPNAPDLVVRLSIDPGLQAAAAEAARAVLAGDGRRAGASQAAVVLLSPDGAIRAMVGGTNYEESNFNRAVQARRQPGSTFKPFVYAAALDQGVMPTDTVIDGPVRFGTWAPENYGGGYRGPVSVEVALINSINTVAVKLAQQAGGGAIGALARRFGFTTLPERPDLSVALGAYEVSLLELTSGFQVFQLGGKRVWPGVIESIDTVGGANVFTRATPVGLPVYDVSRASMMVRMMQKVVTLGTAKRAAFGRPAAGKTGTSQNFRDAWFVGFTPDYVAGVWVGNDDDKPMNRVVGGDLPALIWRRVMVTAHASLAVRDFPWLLPEVGALEQPDPRNGFYETLASEFGRARSEATDEAGPEAPEAPPAAGDGLPY